MNVTATEAKYRRLAPVFGIDGRSVVMLAHEAGSVDARMLRRPVMS